MSKTTFFKRIALTAIAALGFGMLSVAPSQANVTSLTVTATSGTATVLNSDSRTAAVLDFSFLALGSQEAGQTDSFVVTISPAAAFPAGATISKSGIFFTESSTSVGGIVHPIIDTGTANATIASSFERRAGIYDNTAGTGGFSGSFRVAAPNGATAANGVFGVKVKFSLGETTSSTIVKGTYSYNAIVTSVQGGVSVVNTYPFNIVVSDTPANVALAGGTIDPTKSTAVLNDTTGTTATTDAALSKVATSASTTHATLVVKTYTSTSLAAPESVTVTITGPGIVGDGTTFGKSVTFTGAGGVSNLQIRADGTAGVASIVVKTTTVTFPAKSMTFYAKAAKTITASVAQPVIKVGATTDVIRATAVDAEGIAWGGTAYIYASTAADALIAGSNATPAACTFNATEGYHECPVTGTAAGTANFKVIDASTVALATATSNAVDVRVSTGVASTVKLSFDKATYAPGEKAQLRIQVLDGAGLAMPAATITNGFATGGITTSSQLGAGGASTSDLDDVTFDLSGSTSASSNTNAGHKTYVVYMPATAGVVTISATAGTGIALAGRVALTATASVVNNDPAVAAATAASEAATDAAAEAIDAANAATDAANLAAEAADAATVAAEEARDAADAATAAVEALATEVATLMAALKAQITTLANTVAKIAKKVKA